MVEFEWVHDNLTVVFRTSLAERVRIGKLIRHASSWYYIPLDGDQRKFDSLEEAKIALGGQSSGGT